MDSQIDQIEVPSGSANALDLDDDVMFDCLFCSAPTPKPSIEPPSSSPDVRQEDLEKNTSEATEPSTVCLLIIASMMTVCFQAPMDDCEVFLEVNTDAIFM